MRWTKRVVNKKFRRSSSHVSAAKSHYDKRVGNRFVTNIRVQFFPKEDFLKTSCCSLFCPVLLTVVSSFGVKLKYIYWIKESHKAVLLLQTPKTIIAKYLKFVIVIKWIEPKQWVCEERKKVPAMYEFLNLCVIIITDYSS